MREPTLLAHLYFEIWLNGWRATKASTPIDPLPGPPRLDMRLLVAVLIGILLLPARGPRRRRHRSRERRARAPDRRDLIVSTRLERSSTALGAPVDARQRFDHDPMRPAGFDLFGEALLLDYTALRARASTAVDAWMDSPDHREVILTRKMRYVGAGVTRGDFEGERATLRVLQVGRPSRP